MSKSKIRTHCGYCVFARKSKDGVQNGCALDRLEKFKERELAVLNEEAQSFVIDGLCSTCRNIEWLDRQPPEITCIEAVMKEIEIKHDFIIVVPSDADYRSVCEGVELTIRSCIEQSQLPQAVIIVSNNRLVNECIHRFVLDVVDPMFKDSGTNIKYQVVRHFKEQDTFNQLVDVGVGKSQNMFVSAHASGKVIPRDLIERLETLINKDVVDVRMIIPGISVSYPMVIQTLLFKTLSGNKGEPIEQKVINLATKQNRLELIKEWSDIL